MAFKVIVTILAVAILFDGRVEAGHAHSFQHFHGPVIGDGQKVTWHDKHGHHHHDYVAHPHYEFSYGVEDHHTGDYHGQKEHRDGDEVVGEYTVKEPGGNVRTVKYRAGKDGFFAHVLNSDGNDHHGGHHTPDKIPLRLPRDDKASRTEVRQLIVLSRIVRRRQHLSRFTAAKDVQPRRIPLTLRCPLPSRENLDGNTGAHLENLDVRAGSHADRGGVHQCSGFNDTRADVPLLQILQQGERSVLGATGRTSKIIR